jgi:hypothetical protein
MAYRCHRSKDRGGMNQDVQSSEALVDRHTQLVKAVALGDVHGDKSGWRACQGANLIVEGLQSARRSGDSDDMSACGGQGQGGGAADASAGASDKCYAVGKRQVRHGPGS